MDDFLRPTNRPNRVPQQGQQPRPELETERMLPDNKLDEAVEAGEGPTERPTLFTRDAQDAPGAPQLDAEAIADADRAAESEENRPPMMPARRRFARKHLIAMSVVVVALLITGGTLLVFNRSGRDTPATDTTAELQKMTAQVSAIEGTVELKRGEDDWKEIAEDATLQQDDQLRTKDNSRAAITFGDESIVRISSSTLITLTSVANERIVVTDEAGMVYARVAQSKDRLFAVEIDDTLFTATGTAFRTFNTGNTTGVEVYHDSVKVEDAEVKQGEMYFLDSPEADKKGKVLPIDIETLKNDEFIAWCIGQDKDIDAYKDSLGFLGDFDGPELSITAPKDGEVITVSDTSNIGASSVVGKTEKNAKVSIVVKSAGGNSSPIDVTVDALGNYESSLISAPVGKATYEVTARDANGNKTVKTVTVEYKLEIAATPTPTPTDAPVSILSTSFLDGGIKVNWQVASGVDYTGGFQVLWDTDAKPTYPDDQSEYSGSDARIYVIPADKVEDGKTYHIRVCIMKDGACADTSYSNEVTAVAPNE